MTTATAICALRPYQADDLEPIRAALIKYQRVVYALAAARGYRRGWVWHVLEMRRAAAERMAQTS
jgi:hypothetical protein